MHGRWTVVRVVAFADVIKRREGSLAMLYLVAGPFETAPEFLVFKSPSPILGGIPIGALELLVFHQNHASKATQRVSSHPPFVWLPRIDEPPRRAIPNDHRWQIRTTVVRPDR